MKLTLVMPAVGCQENTANVEWLLPDNLPPENLLPSSYRGAGGVGECFKASSPFQSSIFCAAA